MIRLFAFALGLQTTVAVAQTTTPAPAQTTPDTGAAAKPDQTKFGLTLEKF
ncbi:hypothetical protein [Mesorhizobium sp.]|nr:hypothetical protein [Mesorhizobium sp.]